MYSAIIFIIEMIDLDDFIQILGLRKGFFSPKSKSGYRTEKSPFVKTIRVLDMDHQFYWLNSLRLIVTLSWSNITKIYMGRETAEIDDKSLYQVFLKMRFIISI